MPAPCRWLQVSVLCHHAMHHALCVMHGHPQSEDSGFMILPLPLTFHIVVLDIFCYDLISGMPL